MKHQLHIPHLPLLALFSFAALSTAQSPGPDAGSVNAGFQVLHSFSGLDGGSPNALIQASDGFFYGSAATGGDMNNCPPDGCGVLFRMDSTGHIAFRHFFHASDGYLPTGLVLGKDGNFYGTTIAGGQPSGGGGGTFFRMNAAGKLTVLHAFVGGFACCDGGGPAAQPVEASDGNFYGTTGAGGAFRDADHPGGLGTVYQLDPASGALTILHSFNLADGNGIFPNGPLVQASDGLFYGTTRQGGPAGGTAFKIDASGNFALVASLPGTQPLSGVIQASDGFFYGTDEGGPGAGSVYQVGTSGNFSFINLFDGLDGYRPNFGLVQASDGLFYGTTPQGGLLDFQAGDLFRLDANGTLRVLHSFTTTDGTGGYIPNSQLVQGTDGALYGTAGIGGVNGHGTIFRLNPRVPGPVRAVSVRPATVTAGKAAVGMVTLPAPAPAGGTIVTLGATGTQVVLPSTVTVPAGATSAKFRINTIPVSASVTVRIYASVAGAGVRTTLTIVPAP